MNKINVKIRKFKRSDIPRLVEILKLNNQYKNPEVEGPDAMKRVAKCGAAIFLVAEVKNQPRGFIRAIYDGSRALIHLLSVHPAYQHAGIGKALVDAVCAEFHRRGAPTISATVTENSYDFWEKIGFKKTPAFLVLKEIK